MACAAFGLFLLVSATTVTAQTLRERGEYVLRASGCVACHTDTENDGEYLAGGVEFNTPFGIFYSPNITAHPDHGIGNWDINDLISALTRGEGPGGVHYYPVLPYTAYSGMQPEDIRALFAYLQTVPASAQQNKPHKLPWYLRFRFINRIWKRLFFEPIESPTDLSDHVKRGAYLVNVLGHCGECHTPRNLFGALDNDQYLAGTRDGPDGDPVPNITPDADTGIGGWGRNSLRRYLKRGVDPNDDFAGGLMVDVIDEGLRYLSNDDLNAIVDYLKSIPPIINRVDDE
ncbi:MAG: cytochrome c [Gammaproteobacteria bacterium]|jgi:mono/diheme cytochrome c family protein|nr:cytochrome c [Gammaproteobacteria bacterium]